MEGKTPVIVNSGLRPSKSGFISDSIAATNSINSLVLSEVDDKLLIIVVTAFINSPPDSKLDSLVVESEPNAVTNSRDTSSAVELVDDAEANTVANALIRLKLESLVLLALEIAVAMAISARMSIVAVSGVLDKELNVVICRRNTLAAEVDTEEPEFNADTSIRITFNAVSPVDEPDEIAVINALSAVVTSSVSPVLDNDDSAEINKRAMLSAASPAVDVEFIAVI